MLDPTNAIRANLKYGAAVAEACVLLLTVAMVHFSRGDMAAARSFALRCLESARQVQAHRGADVEDNLCLTVVAMAEYVAAMVLTRDLADAAASFDAGAGDVGAYSELSQSAARAFDRSASLLGFADDYGEQTVQQEECTSSLLRKSVGKDSTQKNRQLATAPVQTMRNTDYICERRRSLAHPLANKYKAVPII